MIFLVAAINSRLFSYIFVFDIHFPFSLFQVYRILYPILGYVFYSLVNSVNSQTIPDSATNGRIVTTHTLCHETTSENDVLKTRE